MGDSDERRANERRNLMQMVQLEVGGERLNVSTLDVSETGLSVWAPYAATEGPIGIFLPLDEGAPPVHLVGHVAREYQSDGGAVWGIAFDDLDAGMQARLRAFVEAQAA